MGSGYVMNYNRADPEGSKVTDPSGSESGTPEIIFKKNLKNFSIDR
jgi:hypothetical protein